MCLTKMKGKIREHIDILENTIIGFLDRILLHIPYANHNYDNEVGNLNSYDLEEYLEYPTKD